MINNYKAKTCLNEPDPKWQHFPKLKNRIFVNRQTKTKKL